MSPNRVIVAIDPFHPKATQLRQSLSTIEAFANTLKAEVHAVAVISPDRISWPKDFDNSWRTTFKHVGDLSLRSVLKIAGAPENWTPQILEEAKLSSKAAALALVNFAKEISAEAIAVTARHEGGHLFGGFINHLLSESPVPLLVVNENSEAVKSFSHLLFATDLSEDGKKYFDIAVEYAKRLGAKIHLVNVLIAPPPEVVTNIGVVGGMANLEAFMEAQEADSKSIASKWLLDAKGVSVEPKLFYSRGEVSEAILSACRSFNSDAILIHCHSKTTPFLGSHSRNVIRQSEKPVVLLK